MEDLAYKIAHSGSLPEEEQMYREKMNVNCNNCKHLNGNQQRCEIMPTDMHHLVGFQDYCPAYEEVKSNGLCESNTKVNSA